MERSPDRRSARVLNPGRECQTDRTGSSVASRMRYKLLPKRPMELLALCRIRFAARLSPDMSDQEACQDNFASTAVASNTRTSSPSRKPAHDLRQLV